MKTITYLLLITSTITLNSLDVQLPEDPEDQLEQLDLEDQLLGTSFLQNSQNYHQTGQNLHNQLNSHIQKQVHTQVHHNLQNNQMNLHVVPKNTQYQNVQQFSNQNVQYPNQNNYAQNGYQNHQVNSIIRKNVFNVPAGLHFHPSQIFCLAGQGFQSLLENTCTIRVIYFVELTNQFNNNNERKFIIVFSLKNNSELFLAVEVCLKLGKLSILRSLYLSDLSIIKKNFQINYFDPQIYNYYTNLKQTILKSQKFQNIITAYGWGNMNNYQNWNPLRVNNIHDNIHPVSALKIAFMKMPIIARKIRRIMVLNVSQHNNVFVYLFRIDTKDRKKYYMGIKLQKEQTGLELVTLIIDRHRKACEGILKVKILNRDFMKFYQKITNEFLSANLYRNFNQTTQVNGYGHSNNGYQVVHQGNHRNNGVLRNVLPNNNFGGNVPFLLGSGAPGTEGGEGSEEDSEEFLGEMSDESFEE